jgi:hypothetical protein
MSTFHHRLSHWHQPAHEIEHTLHAFCFLNDIVRFGVFLSTLSHQSLKKLDFLKTTSTLCHSASHFLATAKFLSKIDLLPTGVLKGAFKYTPWLSAGGYAAYAIYLLNTHRKKSFHGHFKQEMAIQLSGIAFEVLPGGAVAVPIIKKIKLIAGMIHAMSVIYFLSPKDVEIIKMTADEIGFIKQQPT